ncbi:hypothetical protein AKJ61_04075, partial [candidate division MSBL1 archaeon SCGC-AAA259B11]
PEEAETLTLLMDDPDAMEPAGKVWDHWVVWNIDLLLKNPLLDVDTSEVDRALVNIVGSPDMVDLEKGAD